MASKLLNIEAGDRLTKVCLTVRHGKTYQIKTSFLFHTPEGAVSDGAIDDPESLAAALKEQLAGHGLSDAKSVVFPISSGKVATRDVTIPPVKDSRILPVVQANASDYFPVDISKYHLAARLLRRVDRGDDAGCQVSVMAAPMSLLEGYDRLAQKAGLELQALDYSGNSQYQALKHLNAQGVVMYVNVDCNSSFVTFIRGDELLLQRSFTFGGDELISAYLSAAGDACPDYVAALEACSVPSGQFFGSGVLSPEEVDDCLSRLVGSIARTTDFFNTNHWDFPAEKVVLMGPCGRLVSLRERVAQKTEVETVCLGEAEGVSSLSNSAEEASRFISCIGSSIAPVDLLPEEFRARSKRTRRATSNPDSITVGLVFCIASAVLTLALCATAVLNYLQLRMEKNSLEQNVAELSYAKDTYDLYLKYTGSQADYQALSDAVDSHNAQLTAFFGELEQKMPSEIRLMSAVCTREGVSMNITVPSLEEASVVLVQLRSFESIDQLQVSDLSQELDEAGFPYVSFSVNCLYPAPPEETTAAGKPQTGKTEAGETQPGETQPGETQAAETAQGG